VGLLWWSVCCALVLLLGRATLADTIVVECEDLKGPWREQTNIQGYSGRGFVVSNAQGTATTTMTGTVHVERPGTYTVWARGWEGGGNDRRWRVQVGGTLLDVTHSGRTVDRWSWQRSGTVELAAGDVEVQAVDAGESFEVADAIMLSDDPNVDPAVEELNWRVLDPERAGNMVLDEVMARTREYARRVPTPKSLHQWRERAEEVRPRVLKALGLGPLPERTPLDARIVGETQCDGYRVERLIFESRPGLPVTANVYVPDGPGPFPLVLNPLGHWPKSKWDIPPQARNHGLAKLGYITITYDPFGQGERAVPGNTHDEFWHLVLTGHTNMSIMVWDTVRALDYMLTRPDVDPIRIACTGASGGGLNTLYYSVVDDRLDVALPVVYITQWEDFLSTRDAHCPCSHIPGLAAFTDMGEMTALFAPKPQYYMNAEEDPMFLPSGVKRAEAQARPIYELFGAGDELRMHIYPGGHDYSRAMREAMYGFVAQHLRGEGDGSPVAEPAFEVFPDDSPALRCDADGQVLKHGKTVRTLAREWAETALAALPEPGKADADDLRDDLAELLNPPKAAEPTLTDAGEFESEGLHIRRFVLSVQEGIELPAFLAAGEKDAPAVVIADAASDPQSARQLLKAAHAVGLSALYVSPRGHGETTASEHVICTDDILLGNSILGQRALDLAQAARALRELPEADDAPVGLLALGPQAGLYGLFSQALWHEFDAVAAGPMPGSYMDSFESEMPQAAIVPNILSVADIPHVAALAAHRPLLAQWTGERGYAARPMEVSEGLDAAAGLSWLAERLAGG